MDWFAKDRMVGDRETEIKYSWKSYCGNNEEVSLSVLSAKLKGYSVKHIAAGGCWLYEGRLLGDMYDEVHPMEEQ